MSHTRPFPHFLAGMLFLVEGRHVPQGLDDARHHPEDFVDVRLGVVEAQGEDQGALGQGVP